VRPPVAVDKDVKELSKLVEMSPRTANKALSLKLTLNLTLNLTSNLIGRNLRHEFQP